MEAVLSLNESNVYLIVHELFESIDWASITPLQYALVATTGSTILCLILWMRIRQKYRFLKKHQVADQIEIDSDAHRMKQILEEITDQKLLLDRILDATDEGIYCLDKQFKCIFWNKGMERITGISRKTISQQTNHFKMFPHLKENGIEEAIRKTMNGESVPPIQYAFELSNNRRGKTLDKFYPMTNSKNQIIGVLSFVQDISEELAREEILENTQMRYGQTLKTLQDGIWDWRINENTILFSDRWFEMLGYSADELSSSFNTMLNLLHSDKEKEQLQADFNTLLSCQEIQTEVCMNTKSGECKWMLIRGRVIETDEEGQPTRALGTQTDITSRKEYEMDLVKAVKKAQESDQLKSSFLANLSHEIRTPLNAIIGFTDLMTSEGTAGEEELENFRQQIRRNSENLLELISDIVMLSMIEAEQFILNPKEFELRELITTLGKQVYAKHGPDKAQKVALSVKAPPEHRNLRIFTDPDLLSKCITSLIDNALSFTIEGRVTVGYLVENNHTHIFIKDTGVGIKPEDQKKIFRHFTQLDQGLTRTSRGTGLGLNLVSAILKSIQGEIELESEINQGSTFTIKIPSRIPSDKP